MKKEVIVLSLGGSLIVPDDINLTYLNNFKKVINKNKKNFKFVIVCGGGSIARKYINALNNVGQNFYVQSLAGISVTRLNARFMSYLFGIDPEKGIPHDMKSVKNILQKNDIVFCGALRYAPNQTSDTTAVRIARYLDTSFINLTNVKGLYDKNPSKYKNAKFIPKASISQFYDIVMEIESKPGMHAPVDHLAIKIIKNNKIKTFILGDDPQQLDNLLNKKEFIGTTISNI
jgi:uridylate kinase